jgi:hypothetical protein
MQALLQSPSAGALTGNLGDTVIDPNPPSPDPAPIPGWGLFEAHGDTELALLAEEQGIVLIAKSLLDHFDEVSVGSEEEEEERSDEEENNNVPEPIVTGRGDKS